MVYLSMFYSIFIYLDVDINKLADLCEIDLGLRAQNLSIDDFSNLTVGYEKLSKQTIS